MSLANNPLFRRTTRRKNNRSSDMDSCLQDQRRPHFIQWSTPKEEDSNICSSGSQVDASPTGIVPPLPASNALFHVQKPNTFALLSTPKNFFYPLNYLTGPLANHNDFKNIMSMTVQNVIHNVEGRRAAGETRLWWSRTMSRTMSYPREHCSKYQGQGPAGETRFKKAGRCPMEMQTTLKKCQQQDVTVNQRFVSNPMNWNHKPEWSRCNL